MSRAIYGATGPSTAPHDRVIKRNLHARSGSAHYWIVDVDAHTLEAFELVDQRWLLVGAYGDDAAARIPPFEQVELAAGRLLIPKPE